MHEHELRPFCKIDYTIHINATEFEIKSNTRTRTIEWALTLTFAHRSSAFLAIQNMFRTHPNRIAQLTSHLSHLTDPQNHLNCNFCVVRLPRSVSLATESQSPTDSLPRSTVKNYASMRLRNQRQEGGSNRWRMQLLWYFTVKTNKNVAAYFMKFSSIVPFYKNTSSVKLLSL